MAASPSDVKKLSEKELVDQIQSLVDTVRRDRVNGFSPLRTAASSIRDKTAGGSFLGRTAIIVVLAVGFAGLPLYGSLLGAIAGLGGARLLAGAADVVGNVLGAQKAKKADNLRVLEDERDAREAEVSQAEAKEMAALEREVKMAELQVRQRELAAALSGGVGGLGDGPDSPDDGFGGFGGDDPTDPLTPLPPSPGGAGVDPDAPTDLHLEGHPEVAMAQMMGAADRFATHSDAYRLKERRKAAAQIVSSEPSEVVEVLLEATGLTALEVVRLMETKPSPVPRDTTAADRIAVVLNNVGGDTRPTANKLVGVVIAVDAVRELKPDVEVKATGATALGVEFARSSHGLSEKFAEVLHSRESTDLHIDLGATTNDLNLTRTLPTLR